MTAPRLVAGLALLVAAHTPAQDLVWEKLGVPEKSWISGTVVVLGDVDRDGHDDLLAIVTALRDGPGGSVIQETQLWTLSGRDGRTLRVRPMYALQRPYFRIAAAGDMDGDGMPDYAALVLDQRNPPSVNLVEVRSGKDDRLIWQVQGAWKLLFGSSLLGGLDLDGDRRPDLVVTAPRWPNGDSHPGAVYAYSSKGKLLYRVNGDSRLEIGSFMGGGTLGRLGDLDRDGADDFVVGGIDKVAGLGAGIVLSGRTGKVLLKGLSPYPREALGHAVAGCGDLDGDGVPDFAVSSAGGTFEYGAVATFSGRTGKVLWSARKTRASSSFGESLASGGQDFDRDGVPDLVVAAPREWVGRNVYGAVYVYSGRDGSLIHRLTGCLAPNPCYSALPGHDLAALRPQPGGRFPLFAVAGPRYGSYYVKRWSGFLYRGRLRLFRGSPSGVRVFGKACAGTLRTTPRIGMRDLGSKGVRIHLSGGAPGARAFLLLGLSRSRWGGARLPLALDPFGFPGCRLFTSIDLVAAVTTGGTGLGRGYAFLDLPLPLAKAGKGSFTLHGQWLSLGQGGTAPGGLSEAMRWRH